MFTKFKPNEIVVLKKLSEMMREIEKPNIEKLTPELLEQLCNRFLQGLQHFPDSANSLFEQPYNGACGCMGPRDGELYCNCQMNNLQYEYRYDIALKLLENKYV